MKVKPFEPMLASSIKVKENDSPTAYVEMVKAHVRGLSYPQIVSPKLDGIRAIGIDGALKSRKLIDLPNRHIQSLLGQRALQGIDSEILGAEPTDPKVYSKSFSAAMTEEGTPDFQLWVFDVVPALIGADLDKSFQWRLDWVNRWYADHVTSYGHLVRLVPQIIVNSPEELFALEEKWVEEGYEGAMTRGAMSPYKHGRSTLKENGLFKVIRKVTEEFKIVGFKERMHNENEATTNNLGRTKRSSHQENKVGRGDLGAFILEIPEGHPVFPAGTFDCGTGLDDAQRADYWARRDQILGQYSKTEHRPYGSKDAPRFPVHKGIRDKRDM